MKGIDVRLCTDSDFWNNFVDQSPQGSVFCRTELFDAYDASVDRWIIARKDSPVAALPIVHSNGHSPGLLPFTYYQGMMFSEEVNRLPPHRKFGWLQEIIAHALEVTTTRYESISLSLHHSFDDIRAFLWHNYHNPEAGQFRVVPRYTALLDLSRFPDEPSYRRAIRKDRRQDLGYAVKAECRISESEDVSLLLELVTASFAAQNIRPDPAELQALQAVASHGLTSGFAELLVAELAEHGPVAAQLVYYDTHSGHAVAAGNRGERRSAGAGAMLYLEMFRRCRARGLRILDFNGANSPSRADYKHSFGAMPRLFFAVDWARGE